MSWTALTLGLDFTHASWIIPWTLLSDSNRLVPNIPNSWREYRPTGIPYGSIARMILLYLQTQAMRTRSREVVLGTSMNAWLTAMDIPVGGKTYAIVREQSRRISRCRLTFFRRTATAELVTNGAFVRNAILPINRDTGD